MKRTLIQKSSTSIVKRLIEQVESLSSLEHHLTNGQLKELFVSNILRSFLPNQYSVGSGIIINKDDEQSKQTDIVIYDNRFLPPFISEQNIGVYPVESVLATIEVKSKLNKEGKDGLKAIDEKAAELHEICEKSLLEQIKKYQSLKYPFCVAVGFNKVRDLSNETAKDWLVANLKCIRGICFINCCCWLEMEGKGWSVQKADETNEETKRFIAVLFDNIWRRGEEKFRLLAHEKNKDWLSCYIRR